MVTFSLHLLTSGEGKFQRKYFLSESHAELPVELEKIVKIHTLYLYTSYVTAEVTASHI